jgi:hypothetical protein
MQWTVGVSPWGERLPERQEFEKPEGFRCGDKGECERSEHEKTEGLRGGSIPPPHLTVVELRSFAPYGAHAPVLETPWISRTPFLRNIVLRTVAYRNIALPVSPTSHLRCSNSAPQRPSVFSNSCPKPFGFLKLRPCGPSHPADSRSPERRSPSRDIPSKSVDGCERLSKIQEHEHPHAGSRQSISRSASSPPVPHQTHPPPPLPPRENILYRRNQ